MFVCCRHTLRVHFVSDAQFHREVEEGGGCITGYFHTPAVLFSLAQLLNFDKLIRIFNDRVEQFTQRGYMLSNIIRLSMIYITFLPLGGGCSYIPTPKSIVRKMAVVNVKSYGTDCFRWAVLSALYPVRRDANQLSSYVRHRDTIDCSELLFPLIPLRSKFSNETIPPLPFTAWLSTIKKTRIPSSICCCTCTDAPTRFCCYYSTIRPAVIANITSGSKVSRALSHPNTRTLMPTRLHVLSAEFYVKRHFARPRTLLPHARTATVHVLNRSRVKIGIH